MPDFVIVMLVLFFIVGWTVQQAAKKVAGSSIGQAAVEKAKKKWLS